MTTAPPLRSLVAPARWLALAAAGLVALGLIGCSGSNDEQNHDVTIVLNVSDTDGNPVGGATVWVDGVAQDLRTAWEMVYLGDGFPESWAGFPANWVRSGFETYTYGDWDSDTIVVRVSKTGYYTQETEFDITGDLPYEVFARDTFIMEPVLRSASAEDAQKVVKHEKPGTVSGEAATGPKPFAQFGDK
jgi:hypothetical protein